MREQPPMLAQHASANSLRGLQIMACRSWPERQLRQCNTGDNFNLGSNDLCSRAKYPLNEEEMK